MFCVFVPVFAWACFGMFCCLCKEEGLFSQCPFAITERRGYGPLYEVPLSVSFVGLWDRGLCLAKLPCVRYYVFC